MKIQFKDNYIIEKKLTKGLEVLGFVALLGFLFNLTISDFLKIIYSREFWVTIPKTFILTMPLFEALFVGISGSKEARKKFYNIFPFTVILLSILYLVLEFGYNISIIEWWISTNNIKSFLLGIIILLILGFAKFEVADISFSFYFAENKHRYSIGGFIIMSERQATVLGVPSMTFTKSK